MSANPRPPARVVAGHTLRPMTLSSLEGVVEKLQYHDRPVRFEYHLTEAGNELRPVLLSLAQWGKRWAAEPTVAFTHSCGEDLDIVHTCKACGEEVTGFDLLTRKLAGNWTSAT